MTSPFQVANWSSRLVSIFHHLLLQHITCRTLHITHCMSHTACYITIHALTCLFQISCSSFCFVSALIEWGQVIPLHVVSADNMADFETALVCLYVVAHSLLYIACRALYDTKHEYDIWQSVLSRSTYRSHNDTLLCNWEWQRCVCIFETEQIIPSNLNSSQLTFRHWYWL